MESRVSLKCIAGSIITALSLFVVAYDKFFEKPIYRVIACGLIIIAFFMLNSTKKDNDVSFFRVIRFIFLTWIICVCVGIIQGVGKTLRLAELESLLFAGLMTFLLCSYKIIILPFKIVFYLFTAYLYYICFFVGTSFFEIFAHGAGGGITILLLSLAIPIQLIDYRDRGRINLLPPVIIIPLSIYGWSRTGLYASLAYLATILVIGVGQINRKHLKILLYLGLTVLFVYLITTYWSLFEESEIYSKIRDQHSSRWANRDMIWVSYFRALTPTTFLFGVPLDVSHKIEGFTNMHNSFLHLHSQTGLYGLIMIVFFLKSAIKYLKYNVFVFLLFLVLILRCIFDMVYFFSMFDFAFFIFLFGQNSLLSKKDNVAFRLL